MFRDVSNLFLIIICLHAEYNDKSAVSLNIETVCLKKKSSNLDDSSLNFAERSEFIEFLNH